MNLHMPSCIKYGSWIGGDRDGNPFVRPKTTEAAALLQSRLIIAQYIERISKNRARLTHSSALHPIDPAFMVRPRPAPVCVWHAQLSTSKLHLIDVCRTLGALLDT